MSRRASQCRGGKLFEFLGRKLNDSVHVKRASQMINLSPAELEHLSKLEVAENIIPLKSSPDPKEKLVETEKQKDSYYKSLNDPGGTGRQRTRNRSIVMSERKNLENRELGQVSEMKLDLDNFSSHLTEIGGLILKAITSVSKSPEEKEPSKQINALKSVLNEMNNRLLGPVERCSSKSVSELQGNVTDRVTQKSVKSEVPQELTDSKLSSSQADPSMRSDGFSIVNDEVLPTNMEIVSILYKLHDEMKKMARMQEQQYQNSVIAELAKLKNGKESPSTPNNQEWLKNSTLMPSGNIGENSKVPDDKPARSEKNRGSKSAEYELEMNKIPAEDQLLSPNRSPRSKKSPRRPRKPDYGLRSDKKLAYPMKYTSLSSSFERAINKSEPIYETYQNSLGSEDTRSDLKGRRSDPSITTYENSLQRIPLSIILNYIEEKLVASKAPSNATLTPKTVTYKDRSQNDSSASLPKERSLNAPGKGYNYKTYLNGQKNGSQTNEKLNLFKEKINNSDNIHAHPKSEAATQKLPERGCNFGVQTIPDIKIVRSKNMETNPIYLCNQSPASRDSQPSKLCVLKDITDEVILKKGFFGRETSSQTDNTCSCACHLQSSVTSAKIGTTDHDPKDSGPPDKNEEEKQQLLSLCQKYLGQKDPPTPNKYPANPNDVLSPLANVQYPCGLDNRIPIVGQVQDFDNSDMYSRQDYYQSYRSYDDHNPYERYPSHAHDVEGGPTHPPFSQPCPCLKYSSCRNLLNCSANSRTKPSYTQHFPTKFETNRVKSSPYPTTNNWELWKYSHDSYPGVPQSQSLPNKPRSTNYSNNAEESNPGTNQNHWSSSSHKNKGSSQQYRTSNTINIESGRFLNRFGCATSISFSDRITTEINGKSEFSEHANGSLQQPRSDTTLARDSNRELRDPGAMETRGDVKMYSTKVICRHQLESREGTHLSSEHSILCNKMSPEKYLFGHGFNQMRGKDEESQRQIDMEREIKLEDRREKRQDDFDSGNSTQLTDRSHPIRNCENPPREWTGNKASMNRESSRICNQSLTKQNLRKCNSWLQNSELREKGSERNEINNQNQPNDLKHSPKIYLLRSDRALSQKMQSQPNNRFCKHQGQPGGSQGAVLTSTLESHSHEDQENPQSGTMKETRYFPCERVATQRNPHQSVRGRRCPHEVCQEVENFKFLNLHEDTTPPITNKRTHIPNVSGLFCDSHARSTDWQHSGNNKQITNDYSRTYLNDTSLVADRSVCINGQSDDSRLSSATQTLKPPPCSLSECDLTCCSEPINSSNDDNTCFGYDQQCGLPRDRDPIR